MAERHEYPSNDRADDRAENRTPEPDEAELDPEFEEREPSSDFPDIPARDLGPSGTRDVDPPPNTGGHPPHAQEPPD